MYRRTAFQRLQDIVFRLRRDHAFRKCRQVEGSSGTQSSVSGSSPWVTLAGLAENPAFDITHLRRHPAVLQIVETVGPTDGIAYADFIQRHGARFLSDDRVICVDDWGNPMQWPWIMLGAPRSFSPTTLRYLATALWLRSRGLITDGSAIVEVGVGFGGLAAMNHIVSGCSTLMIDLPPVEGLARRMVRETTNTNPMLSRDGIEAPEDTCFVSNYAFTELSSELQDICLERWILPAQRGLIVSNATVFSHSVGGRNDNELLALLQGAGKEARLLEHDELMVPTDYLHGNRLIVW